MEQSGETAPPLVCGFCGSAPEEHIDSDYGPMTLCPAWTGNNWGRGHPLLADGWKIAQFGPLAHSSASGSPDD